MATFKKGDVVEIIPGAKFAGDIEVPAKYAGAKMYVRELRPNNTCTIGLNATAGRSAGLISMENLRFYNEIPTNFTTYYICTIAETTTKEKPDPIAKDKKVIAKNKLFTIIDEKDGYGRLKNDLGWINLADTKKIG